MTNETNLLYYLLSFLGLYVREPAVATSYMVGLGLNTELLEMFLLGDIDFHLLLIIQLLSFLSIKMQGRTIIYLGDTIMT